MRFCDNCKFWRKFQDTDRWGICKHPVKNGEAMFCLSRGCPHFRSTKWKGCLVAFPKGIAIAFVYLFDLLIVYFLFGKTLYKRTQGKDKTND